MFLENLVFDAVDPWALGRFWSRVVGAETLTDGAGGFEARYTVPDGPTLDLCFQPVPEAPAERQRIVVRVGAEDPEAETRRLLELGARRGPEPGTLLDPEGGVFVVVPDGGTGPLAAIVLESSDPARDVALWSLISGWDHEEDEGGPALRHRSGRGPVVLWRPEISPKPERAKNRRHLDVRLEAGQELAGVGELVLAQGATRFGDPSWGELPWHSFRDASGNEFCALPAPSGA